MANLDFRYLPAFAALVEQGNFTRAGIKLRIATSAVSRQIQLLEESCAEQLFFRSPQEVKLTSAGERLYQAVKRFLTEADGALGHSMISRLRIGTLEGVLQNWLADVIAGEELFQGVSLELRIAPPDELISRLAEGELDAAFFSYVHHTQVPASLQIHRLFKEDITLISKEPVRLDQIDRHPWVYHGPTTWITRFTDKRPARTITVNSMRSVIELVKRGVGIAMVPSYMLSPGDRLYRKPIKEFSEAHICMATRRYENPPQIMQEFMAAIRRHSTY